MNLDLTVARTFRITEKISVDFPSEFFDLFNDAHFSGTSSSPRQIQFGLKPVF